MDPAALNPSSWAESGGILGLVIFALFASLFIFIKAIASINDSHRADMLSLLTMQAEERKEWGRLFDARQQETNSAINGVTAALNQMASRRRAEEG